MHRRDDERHDRYDDRRYDRYDGRRDDRRDDCRDDRRDDWRDNRRDTDWNRGEAAGSRAVMALPPRPPEPVSTAPVPPPLGPDYPRQADVVRPPHPSSGIDLSVGDWACSNCGNWNWARRNACNKCGAARYSASQTVNGDARALTREERKVVISGGSLGASNSQQAASQAAAAARARGKNPEPHQDFGYVVPKTEQLAPGAEGRIVAIQALAGWEKRPKGMAGSAEKREGAAGGFREFDGQAEEDRRKAVRESERAEKEIRKAVRSKCPFCKRASCLC